MQSKEQLSPGDLPRESVESIYQMFLEALADHDENLAAFRLSLLYAAGQSLDQISQRIASGPLPKKLTEDIEVDGEVSVDDLRETMRASFEDILIRHTGFGAEG